MSAETALAVSYVTTINLHSTLDADYLIRSRRLWHHTQILMLASEHTTSIAWWAPTASSLQMASSYTLPDLRSTRLLHVSSDLSEDLIKYSNILCSYISNVSSYPGLDMTGEGPLFEFEYSARETYGKNISWPADAPLNATWWHKVTEGKPSHISPRDSLTKRLSIKPWMRTRSLFRWM